MKKIFLATGNKKKIEEMKAILKNYEVLSINDGYKIPDVVEDRETFEGNSQKKAQEIADHLGIPVIADDSGLCVDVLDGAPGVYSARYSGEEATDEKNNLKLIKELEDKGDRKAKFVCVVTYAEPNGEIVSFRGELEGTILKQPQGDGGFGYDPLFYVEEYGKALSEIPVIKNKISHRANALKKLNEWFQGKK